MYAIRSYYAVLRVDLQPRIAAVFVAQNFIDSGGAVTLFRRVVERQIVLHRNRRVGQSQVDRLVLFVVGAGEVDRRVAIERHHTVRLGVLDLRHVLGRLERFVVGLVVVSYNFV